MKDEYANNFFFIHHMMMEKYKSNMERILVDFDLSSAEVDVLTFLINNEGKYDTATDISNYRGISKSLVSKSVNTLMRKGYLSASPNEDDNRFMNLTIVDNDINREIKKKVKDENKLFTTAIRKGISQEEYNMYNNIAKKMHENVIDFYNERGK